MKRFINVQVGIGAATLAILLLGVGVWQHRSKTESGRIREEKKGVAPEKEAPSWMTGSGLAPAGVDAARSNTVARTARSSAENTDLDAEAKEIEKALAPVQEDLDSADAAKVVAAATRIMNHPNPQVRLRAVEALSAADDAAGLPGLVSMLTDKDDEVATAAMDAWRQQMLTMDGEDKADMVEMVGDLALEKGVEAFQDLMMTMNDIPDDRALQMLKTFADNTQNPEIIEQILGEVNFRLQLDDPVERKEDIDKAVQLFMQRPVVAEPQ